MNKSFFYKLRALLATALMATGAEAVHAQCSPVTIMTVNIRRCDSVNLTWTPVPGITNYLYRVSTSSNPTGTAIGSTAGTAEIGDLLPNTQYYAHVRSNCGATTSTWYTVPFMTTVCAPGVCLPPAQGLVSNITSSTATFAWSRFSNALGYEFLIDQVYADPAINGTAVTDTFINLAGLTGGTNYYVHLRSRCGANSYSPWKTTGGLQTIGFDPGCTPVSAINVTIRRCDSVDISWPAPPGVTAYFYTLSTSPTQTGGSSLSTNTVSRRNLIPGTKYYVGVRSRCNMSSGSWVTDSFTLPACGGPVNCDPVSSLAVNVRRCDSATFSWPAVAQSLGYEYAATQSATPPASGTFNFSNVAQKGGLLPGTAYYLHVRTGCSSGSSAWNTQPFNTPLCNGSSSCTAPATVNVSNITQNAATVSWTPATAAIGYEYVLSTAATTPAAGGTLTTAASVSLSGLTVNTVYYWHIRSKCDPTTFSPWKSPVQLKTLAPTGIAQVSSGSVVLSVFPSPAGHSVTVALNSKPGKHAAMAIYSIDGRMVKALVPAMNNQVDIAALQNGIYLIRYSDEGQNLVTRFTKQ